MRMQLEQLEEGSTRWSLKIVKTLDAKYVPVSQTVPGDVITQFKVRVLWDGVGGNLIVDCLRGSLPGFGEDNGVKGVLAIPSAK